MKPYTIDDVMAMNKSLNEQIKIAMQTHISLSDKDHTSNSDEKIVNHLYYVNKTIMDCFRSIVAETNKFIDEFNGIEEPVSKNWWRSGHLYKMRDGRTVLCIGYKQDRERPDRLSVAYSVASKWEDVISTLCNPWLCNKDGSHYGYTYEFAGNMRLKSPQFDIVEHIGPCEHINRFIADKNNKLDWDKILDGLAGPIK